MHVFQSQKPAYALAVVSDNLFHAASEAASNVVDYRNGVVAQQPPRGGAGNFAVPLPSFWLLTGVEATVTHDVGRWRGCMCQCHWTCCLGGILAECWSDLDLDIVAAEGRVRLHPPCVNSVASFGDMVFHCDAVTRIVTPWDRRTSIISFSVRIIPSSHPYLTLFVILNPSGDMLQRPVHRMLGRHTNL